LSLLIDGFCLYTLIVLFCKVGALSDDARLTFDVCLSLSSGLSREQRGLGRLECHRALTGMPPFVVPMEEGRYDP